MNTKLKNISVVIPLYNKEKYIKRAINSVKAQTYQCFELLVVNDGSTDNGLAKVKEIEDERLRIFNQTNLGESAARNKGIAEAKYDLIAFLDADDQWEPECLENMAYIANKYENAGIISVAYKIINPEGKMIYPDFKFVPKKEGIIENYFKAALLTQPVCASSLVVRREVFDKLGGFAVGMRHGPDTFMWAKVALNYPIAFIYKFLATIYENTDDRVSTNYKLVDDIPLFQYITSLDKEIEEEEYFYIREFVYLRYLWSAKRCLRTGDKKRARIFISKAKGTELFKNKYIRYKKRLYLSYPVISSLFILWRKLKKQLKHVN